jgi:hypothetical protein
MSTITTHAARDSDRDSDQVLARFMSYAQDERDRMAVYQLIAHVLRRAHLMAEDLDQPNEARAIFHVALSFADELTTPPIPSSTECASSERRRGCHDASRDDPVWR